MSIKWPDTLIREIAERRVVLFIGSGISKSACPALPTWNSLLNDLTDRLSRQRDKTYVRRLIGQGRLLDAAQVIRDGLNRPDLNARFREIFQVRPTPNHEIYKNLLLLDPKTIITTNYDEFIEENFKHYSRGEEAHSISDQKSKKLLNDLRSPIRSIVKLHGSIDDPGSLVLDRMSFFEARRDNPGLFSIISSLMTVNTVLFLGYSVSDPDIQIILENITLNSPSDHSHYAVVPKFDHAVLKGAMEKTYNISFVEYPTGAHDQVNVAIESLAEAVQTVRTARRIV